MLVKLLSLGILLLAPTLQAQDNRKAKEAELGAHLAQRFQQRNTLFESRDVQDYIERLATRLDAKGTYHLAVVTDGIGDYPVTFPGGYVFLSVSQILSAKDEAQLAVVLAHAMVHAMNPERVRVADGPLVFVGGWHGAMLPQQYHKIHDQYEIGVTAEVARMMVDYQDPGDGELARIQGVAREATPPAPPPVSARPRKPPTLGPP